MNKFKIISYIRFIVIEQPIKFFVKYDKFGHMLTHKFLDMCKKTGLLTVSKCVELFSSVPYLLSWYVKLKQ